MNSSLAVQDSNIGKLPAMSGSNMTITPPIVRRTLASGVIKPTINARAMMITKAADRISPFDAA